MTEITPSIDQLRRAIQISEEIALLEAELNAVLGEEAKAAMLDRALSSPMVQARKKGGMSALGRARIAAAQKARWAKVKASQPAATTPAAPTKKRRTISAAHRAKLKAAA